MTSGVLRLAVIAVAALVVASPGAGAEPSGGKIVFERTGVYADEDSGDILVMNADGSGVRNLTPGRPDETDPAWAPDGSRIAFVSTRPTSRAVPHIYLARARGGPVRRLTSSRWSDNPVWSPDGARIAFLRHVLDPPGNRTGDRTTEVFVMNADGSDQRKLTRNSLDEFDLGWSRTGKLSFTQGPGLDNAGAQIFVMNPDGTDLRQLTRNRFYDAGAAWSPDGRRIAFVRSSRNLRVSSVWVMNPDGSGQRRLIPPSRVFDPRGVAIVWSPDGSKIALRWGRTLDIYVMNADGNGLRRVVRGRPGAPTWSPDGRKIAFHRHPALYVANADGTAQRRLLPPPGAPPFSRGENWSPVWSGNR